jgi:phosphoadenosine phosphosulfate reductase
MKSMIDSSINLIKNYEPEGGYYGCFSGGKDSIVIKELARLSKVKSIWHYHVTTIDPPPLVRFIRRHHPEVVFDIPKRNFFNTMLTRGFPTRRQRWCCDRFKHVAPKGKNLLMGLRAEESSRRANQWSTVRYHTKYKAAVINPIFYWSSDEVWRFIRNKKLPYPELYDQGFHRLGCIGCPMSRAQRKIAFERWPQYEKLWRQAFKRIWEKRSGKLTKKKTQWFGDKYFLSWQEMFDWWLSDRPLPDKRQRKLIDIL